MLICSSILLFAFCSIVGWVFESALAIVKTGKWERRGFLYGPVCPIYGVGVVAIVLVAKAVARFAGFHYEWVHVALAAFFGSMILEYVTSWLLERLFNAYWWDYSDMPLNINGRTCIPAACLFSAGGLAAVYVISPAWDSVVGSLSLNAVIIAAMAVLVLVTIDFTLTISSLTSFQAQVTRAEQTFNERASKLTDKVTGIGPSAAELISTERERLRDMDAQTIVEGMSDLTRAALSRIEGFRPHPIENHPDISATLSRALEKAKSLKRK